MKKEVSKREQVTMQVSRVSMAVNLLLSVFKIIAGFVAHSGAMISDGVHSASDVLSTVVVIIGVKLGEKAADENHPYGHERLECVAAVILSLMLALTGVGIGFSGIQGLSEAFHGERIIPIPGILALSAALISIIIKEAMYRYTVVEAKKIRSDALMADAWHHRSDALSSVGSFAGILGARLGYAFLDPVAAVLICLFILKAALEIFLDAIRKMTDEAADQELVKDIKRVILEQEGVLGIDIMRTRVFGSRVYVDVDISADGSISLYEAHRIADRTHNKIEETFRDVKHIMVHVNPYSAPDTASKR